MNGITISRDRETLVAWAREVLVAVGDRADKTAVDGVEQAIKSLKADRFCLAVIGKAKRGKSTLLNAILGRRDDKLAPVDKLPASSAISRFRWASTESAAVVYRDGRREQIGFDRIREFVTEEGNKGNAKEVDVVEIAGPFPGLDHDVELVDTPGAGSIHEHHDALLHAFIPQADAVIFMVTARMPLDQDEIDLLKELKAADIRKVFFVVNRVDESNEQDITDAIAHNSSLLSQAGIQVDRMHRISAKAAFKGDLAGSGVAALMQDIAGFLAANKGSVLSARFVARVRTALEPVAQALSVEAASGLKTVEELDVELKTLRQKKTAIESERGISEREFLSAWNKAADAYAHGLKNAKTAVHGNVLSKVQRASVFEVSGLAKQLPTMLSQSIDEHISPLAARFELAAKEACDRLQANYPSLDVGDAGVVSLRTREGSTAITGALGGVAAAAAGTGIVVAGTTAAASIAATNAAVLAAAATSVAATAAPTTGILGFLGANSLMSFIGLGGAEASVTGIGTLAVAGTATPAATSIALTATPFWVALAGPIGWTLAGVGLVAVPFSWRLSKLKLKDKIEEACEDQINKVFQGLESDRMPAIRAMGKNIAEEVSLRLERQLAQITAALANARNQRPSDAQAKRLSQIAESVRGMLHTPPGSTA